MDNSIETGDIILIFLIKSSKENESMRILFVLVKDPRKSICIGDLWYQRINISSRRHHHVTNITTTSKKIIINKNFELLLFESLL